MSKGGFEDLEVYKESIGLTKLVFDLCKTSGLIRDYSFCDQIKRASVSVCANIAEGYGRNSKADFKRFLTISIGSANEVVALLDVLHLNWPHIKIDNLREQYVVLGKRVYVLRQRLKF